MKERILIADDTALNRELLGSVLGDRYEYLYAENGMQVVELLGEDARVDIILLDINMPEMGGFEVLEIMQERRWLEEIPVIVISAEHDPSFIRRAYELGATDYIALPFDSATVIHRVRNTLALYSRQRRLVQLVEEQVYEREKINHSIIGIFSQVIESRNHESGSHTLHMQTITNLMLHELAHLTDQYRLTEADISMISSLSALHDIGKIAIPEEILNKPGKLTPDEWEIMKSHTVIGDNFLRSVQIASDDPMMQTAHAICRWHHERWDGRGYPDGLKGEEIPIAAQVVALADVYDALTSDRCYKKAYPHETAIQMICAGECGAFNPLLLRCLREIAPQLKAMGDTASRFDYRREALHMAGEMLRQDELPLDDRSRRLLENERKKKEFFARQCGGIQFEYDSVLRKVAYLNWYEGTDGVRRVLNLARGDNLTLLSETDWNTLVAKLNATTREQRTVVMEALIPVGGARRWHRITAMTVWPVRGEKSIGALGQMTDIHEKVTGRLLEKLSQERGLSVETFRELRKLFGTVRLVDPADARILEAAPDGTLTETDTRCYEMWGRTECCENCSSAKAMTQDNWVSKLEVKDGHIYSILSKKTRACGRDCALEIAFRMDDGAVSPNGAIPDKTGLMLLNFYRDSLTEAYSRIYLNDFLPNLEQADGVAIADVDHFKQINDTYGHPVGDIALRSVSDTILSCIRGEDVLIRYGGDEFLLIFNRISHEDFLRLLDRIRTAVRNSSLADYPDIRLDISIGGAYQIRPLAKAIAYADRQMYEAKNLNRTDG